MKAQDVERTQAVEQRGVHVQVVDGAALDRSKVVACHACAKSV
jgi:hypothetical protein